MDESQGQTEATQDHGQGQSRDLDIIQKNLIIGLKKNRSYSRSGSRSSSVRYHLRKSIKVSQKVSSRFKVKFQVTITVSWTRFNIENRTSFKKKGGEEEQKVIKVKVSYTTFKEICFEKWKD